MRAPRRRYAAVLVAGALAAAGLVSEAPTALAAVPVPTSGPCPENSNVSCHFQYGEVWFDGINGYAGVDDGDTIDVNLYDKGTTHLSGNKVEVRFTGINSPEFIKHSSTPNKWVGDGCHAIPAAHIVYDAVQNNRDNPNHVVRL